MSIQLFPIGTVRNGIHKRPEKWADIISEIHINPQFCDALEGLDQFSHIIVIFHFHLSTSYLLKVHPRGNPDLPLVGVFSTRAPVRPNFLGVTTVELITVDRNENILTVKGLDTFDGTPIIDIKPHLSCTSPEKVAEWVNK